MIELDNIKLQTTWNDAAQSINLNFATIDIVVERLSAALENAGVSFDSIEMWKLLGLGTAEQIASTHLTDALASYATQAYVTAEINALIGGAPSTLDTLKEIADAIAAGGTAMDALVVTVGEKASQSDLNAAVTRVAALETLTTTGKVHNSDLLDGIDSLGFVRIAETGEQVMSGSLKLVNLTATGSISAMSANPLADNIGMGGMDTEAMWQELRTSSTDPDKVIDISHIPNLTTAKITDIETWISGKGYLTSIPVASDSVLGGIKLGFPASSVEGLGFNVPVLLDSANRAYVSIDIRDVDDMYGYTPVAPSAIADMATKTWVGGNYLPLGGGTVEGTVETPLVVNTSHNTGVVTFLLRTNGVAKTSLGWSHGDGSYFFNQLSGRYMGVKDDGTPYYYNGSHRTLYHEGNFNPAEYLPLSGGTINGNDSEPLWINTSYTEGIEIPLRINGVNKGYFGWWNDWRGVFMYSAATGGCLAINDTDGKAYYNNKELIHTGNIGSQRVDYSVRTTHLYAADEPYRYGDIHPYYAYMTYDSNYEHWYLRVSPETPKAVAVDRAFKLADTRSIWGQSFDGTGNVDGKLIVYGAASGNIPSLIDIQASTAYSDYETSIRFTDANGRASVVGRYSNRFFVWNSSCGETVSVCDYGYVGIGITYPAYLLDVNGDSYTRGWARADNGFYMEGAIVYYSAVSSYASIASNGDEICISGNNNSTLYVNYRKGITGYAPTEWVWNDGTPSSYAKFRLGELETYGDIISHGSISAQTANPLADMIGSSGEYLPLTGGTISGDLYVNAIYPGYIECFGSVYIYEGIECEGGIFAYEDITSNGVMRASEFSTSSDYRLKDIHDTYNVDFGKLKAIPKVFFTWKNGDTQTMQFGTIAQEVEKVMPEIVRTNSNGYLSVSYDRFGLIALAAIDVLHTTQETQEEKIKRLEKRVKELESWKETRLRMQS